MAVAERETIPLLGDDWDIPGIYVLLYPVAADATFDLYIGKASTGGLRSRLLTHKVAKENWTRVLLVARDTTHGFNSAQVGWLDGRLWSVAKAAAGVKIVNGNQPKDETLPAFERASLEFAIAPIRQVMRLLGYALDPEDETVPVKAGIGRRYHGVTLQDLLAAQLLKAGDSLEFTYAGHEGVSAVVDSKGQLVLDGAPYGSPSAAGFAARGGIVNGWQHWAVRDAKDNLVSLGELRAKLPPKSVG